MKISEKNKSKTITGKKWQGSKKRKRCKIRQEEEKQAEEKGHKTKFRNSMFSLVTISRVESKNGPNYISENSTVQNPSL